MLHIYKEITLYSAPVTNQSFETWAAWQKYCKLLSHILSSGIVEVYKLESNEKVRLTLESMQMPIVEYKEINMDDYSMYQTTRLLLYNGILLGT